MQLKRDTLPHIMRCGANKVRNNKQEQAKLSFSTDMVEMQLEFVCMPFIFFFIAMF